MPTRRDFHKLSLAAAFAALPGVSLAQNEGEAVRDVMRRRENSVKPEVYGTHGVIAAGTQFTVEAGTRILAAGGNAFDAGVAAVFAAAVNEFSHFGLGGEAPALVLEAATGKVSVICGQGTAPRAATPAYFRSAGVIPGNGPNGGTIPAVIDAMALTLQQFGTFSLNQVLEPALQLADGFPMYGVLRDTLIANRENTEKWAWGRRTYYPGGRVAELGEVFRQPNLAATLRTVAAAETAALARGASRTDAIEAARNEFYKGDIARRIAAAVQDEGGLMTYDDLASYRGRVEEPLSTSFHGYEVYKAGFWSQGPALLMSLNILDSAGIGKLRHGGEPYLHTLIETLKLAYDDRNAWFGDPLFAEIPAEGLLSKGYAMERAALIGEQASLQHRIGNPFAHQREGKRPARPFVPHRLAVKGGTPNDTTAIEIVDAKGNLFSCTPSSGWLMGGAYIAGDTGVPLSNRMTVFDLDPTSPNVLAGGKRPRTTLTPTIVTRGGKPFAAVGTPGGDSQDQQILQTLLNLILAGHGMQEAIEAPRLESFHFHQSFEDKRDAPGKVEIEGRVPVDAIFALERRGHKVDVTGPYGISTALVAVGIDPKYGTLRGGADLRGRRVAFGW